MKSMLSPRNRLVTWVGNDKQQVKYDFAILAWETLLRTLDPSSTSFEENVRNTEDFRKNLSIRSQASF